MANYTEREVYQVISDTLMNFKGAAKYAIARHWKNMTRTQHYSAMRALVYMESVARNPAVYFSRTTTIQDWSKRALKTRRLFDLPMDDGMENMGEGSPGDIVCARASEAFEASLELRNRYRLFCNTVVRWEYDRTSQYVIRHEQVQEHIEKIMETASQSKTWRIHASEKKRSR